MGGNMVDNPGKVLLPVPLPCTKSLRAAVSAIIRDIQHSHHELDQETADRLGVSVGTVGNARNEKADLGALTIAKIGLLYGPEAVAPYNALYGATAHATHPSACDPLPELGRAIAALAAIRNGSPKDRLDALPVLKAASAALDAYIASIETLRLVA